jgi:DNA-binding CsgD family transcriptional regulator
MDFNISYGPDGLRKSLTPRQEQVAQLLARGLDVGEIALLLQIVRESAQMHVNAIADKIENPHKLPPLKLARQWAIAREFNRQGREPIVLTPGEEREIEIHTTGPAGRGQTVLIRVDESGQVAADVVASQDGKTLRVGEPTKS